MKDRKREFPVTEAEKQNMKDENPKTRDKNGTAGCIGMILRHRSGTA